MFTQPNSSYHSSTPNCGSWRHRSWPTKSPARRSTPRPWSMKLILRLVAQRESSAPHDQHWDGRGHFFGAAAEAMRRILVENARKKRRKKRGGDLARKELNAADLAAPEVSDDLLALDDALTRLAKVDDKAAKLVQLRFFGGLSLPQAAEVLEISPRSADRLWAYARARLHTEIYGE